MDNIACEKSHWQLQCTCVGWDDVMLRQMAVHNLLFTFVMFSHIFGTGHT